jgi:hypothetical protein
MTSPAPAARIRGVATGLLTAALAVAAHGVGGGPFLSGAATVQLAVVAATIGALAATLPNAGQTRVLLGLLAAGQLLGHVLLGASGHEHSGAGASPPAVMLAAHVLAIATGAVLIAAGDRLWRAVSRAVRVVLRCVRPPVVVMTGAVPRRADQPLRSALLIAASVSHRGPPVGFVR